MDHENITDSFEETASFSDVPSDDNVKILRDGTNLGHSWETPIKTTSSNENREEEPTRRKLEDRFTSRISQLRGRTAASHIVEPETLMIQSEQAEGSSVKVLKFKTISKLICSPNFRYQYGSVQALAVGECIVLGTSKGQILVFDLQQTSEKVLQEKRSVQSGAITALTLSADSTYVAAGYADGSIYVWDISKSTNSVLAILSINQKDLTKGNKEGHLVGSKIHHLNFVGKRHTALISADNNGLLCYHNGYRNVLGYHVISRKILGRYSQNSDSKPPIIAAELLPLGTSPEPTDTIGLTAIMTPHSLIVISIYPQLQTHLKVGRPSGISKSLRISACIAWLPALLSKNGKSSAPKLCYCWSNVLTIFDLNNEVMKNPETNEESVFVKFTNKKRWIGKESFVAVQWLNNKIIAALTNGHRLLFISESSMQVLTTVDLLGKDICALNLFDNSLFESVYSNSFMSLKGKLFLIGENDLLITSLNNWADILVSMIKNGNHIAALKRAREFYSNDNEDFIIYGLPPKVNEKKALLYDSVVHFMAASLEYIFNDLGRTYEMEQNVVSDFLMTYFEIYHDFEGQMPPETLEDAFEKFKSFNLSETYFACLKEFILKEKIVHLTPTVFKALVEEFTSNGQGAELEELICFLDITTLDIDLAISLCEQHHLQDTLVYIWNVALNDFVTPFFEFVRMIVEYNRSSGDFAKQDALRSDAAKVYGYLSYTLTGRQYPTERLIDFDRVRRAKMNIYYALFSGASLTWPKGAKTKIHITENVMHEPAFPYLYLLLKFNCFATFGALNEIFEDDFLNDNGPDYDDDPSAEFRLKATRQYIIGILFEVYKSSNDEFSALDKTYLAIFVARNYPKYKQFIDLSDSICEDLIETLCSYPDATLKEDCELSLQSLLSVYRPLNLHDLIYFFESAGFYEVLFNVYRSEQQFHKVLEIWASNKKRRQLEYEMLQKKSSTMEKDSDIVGKCFELTKNNPSERNQVNKFIKLNFKELVDDDLSAMVKLFAKYSPALSGEILEIDDYEFCFRYLKCLFQNNAVHGMSKEVQKRLKIKYMTLMSLFDKQDLFKFLKEFECYEEAMPLIHEFEKNGAIDCVIYLLEYKQDYPSCIKKISNHLALLKVQTVDILRGKLDFAEFSGIETDLWKYLFIAIRICDYNTTQELNIEETSLTQNEWAWLTMAQSVVDVLKAVNTELVDKDVPKNFTYILDTVKRLVQDLFVNLINSSSSEETELLGDNGDSDQSVETMVNRRVSFFSVFNEFLNDSSCGVSGVTRLSDVRLVLSEIFLSYKYDTVLQKTVLKLLSERIFQEFEVLNAFRLKGMTLKSAECDACGKALWGSHIENAVYGIWRDNQLEVLTKRSTDFTITELDPLSVTIFKCGHAYHEKCLLSYGGTSAERGAERLCIFCEAVANY